MNRTSASKYFTRHLLRAGLQCPVKLFYKANNYPEDNSILPFLQHAGFNKHFLKMMAARLYPYGQLVNEESREEAAKKTAELLKQRDAEIFEATFIDEDCYSKVPILIKDGAQCQLIDIQTKAFNPRKHSILNPHGRLLKKWQPYIVDLAFKKMIVQQLFPEYSYDTHLLLPDKTKSAGQDHLLRHLENGSGNLQNEDLFCRLDVTTEVDSMLNQPVFDFFNDMSFGGVVTELKNRYFNREWCEPPVGRRCNNCEFRISKWQQKTGNCSGFDTCWSESDRVAGYDVSEPTVLDLIGPGIGNWLDRDIYLQKQVKLAELPPMRLVNAQKSAITQKQRQTLQVRRAKGKEIPAEIVKSPVFDEINRWQYPLHFLDFEAGNYAIPIHKNRKPYNLVLFQFSCHTLYANDRLVHHQWIAENDDVYPNYDLVRKLRSLPDINDGTIIQYSTFEQYALKMIRKELRGEADEVRDAEELIHWLKGIVGRHDSHHHSPPYLADMSRLVKNYYFNQNMGDSLSIKHVLQSILTISDALKEKYSRPYKSNNFENIIWWQWDETQHEAQNPYHILQNMQQDFTIGRGTEAMVEYGKLLTGSLSAAEKKNILQSLLKYCELDTLAMVMIFEHWNSLAQGSEN